MKTPNQDYTPFSRGLCRIVCSFGGGTLKRNHGFRAMPSNWGRSRRSPKGTGPVGCMHSYCGVRVLGLGV